MTTIENDIEELEGPFEQIAGVEATDGSDGSSDGPILDIYYKDEPVTGQTKDIWVGQFISLVAKGDSPGQIIEDPLWTVPGKIVAGYKVEPATAGVLTPFDTESLKNTFVWFYWAASGSKKVTFRGTINGVRKEVSATFNVQRPTVSVLISKNTKPKIEYLDPPLQNKVVLSKTVEWDRHGQTQEGQICWVQLVEGKTTILFDNVNYSQGLGLEFSGKGLDGAFPYTKPDDPLLQDTPLVGADRHVAFALKDSGKFEDWVLFKHKEPGSIWVPLKKMEWFWWANASRIGPSKKWTIDAMDYEKNPQARDSDEFPVWDSLVPDPPVLNPINY